MKPILCCLALALLGTTLVEAQERFAWGGRRRGGEAIQPERTAPAVQPTSNIQAGGIRNAPPQVDKAEVIRRGDLEEYVDGSSRFSNEYGDHIAQIASTPANDNEKWFISVISKKGCPLCARLKEAWKTDDTLRAYAKPEEPKTSWAHFTWYDYDDPYQKWRWTKSPSNPNALEITAFPTIVVQPPRSKAYGNPQTVVLKYVYEDSPQKFSAAVNGAIRAYVDTLHKRNELRDVPDEETREAKLVAHGGYGQLDPKDTAYVPPDSGIGQTQIPPPLVLPLDDAPPAQQPGPLHRIGAGSRRQILIVTDESLVTDADQEQEIARTVAEMQQVPPVPVRKIDVTRAPKGLPVKADEIPVVLLMEGSDLLAKRPVPKPASLGPVLEGWFGLGKILGYVCAAVGVIVFGAMLLLATVVGVRVLQWAEILPKPLVGGKTTTGGTA